MKNLLFLLLALAVGQHVCAQSVTWDRVFTSSREVEAYDAAVLNNNSVFFVGALRSSCNFGNGYTLTANSYNGGTNSDGWLLKTDGAGNTQWAKRVATDANSGDALHVEVVNDHVYVVSQDADAGFDYYTLAEKYDTNGTLIWAKTKQSTSSYWVKDMFVDGNGDLYLLYYRSANHYITKYASANGNELFTITIHSSYDEEPEDIAVDANGDMYVLGFTSPASYNRRLLVEKIRWTSGSSYSVIWQHIYGSTNQEAYGFKVTIDDSANLYLAGSFNKSFSLGGSVNLTTGTTSSSTSNGFLAKLDSAGNTLWAVSNNNTNNVGTSSGTGYRAMDVQVSRNGQYVFFLYGNQVYYYDPSGNYIKTAYMPAMRYFGLAEAPDGSIYSGGEIDFEEAHCTKLGCPAVGPVIDSTVFYGDTVFGYTETGTYIDALNPGTIGCDSNRTLNLQVIGNRGITCPTEYDTTLNTMLAPILSIRYITFPSTPNSGGGATLTFQFAACGSSSTSGGVDVYLRVTSGGTNKRIHEFNGVTNCTWANRTVTITPSELDSAIIAGGGSIIVGFAGQDACVAGVGCASISDPAVRNFRLFYNVQASNFQASTTNACTNNAVTFTNTTNGTVYAQYWEFPGGTPSSSFDATVNVTYNTPGTYDVTMISQLDCGVDTLHYTNYITVDNGINSTINQTICEGDTVLGYYTTGTFADTYALGNGCDSIRTLNLTVLAPLRVTIDTSLCFGGTYAGYGNNGVYVDTYTAINGCDSIRTLTLTVLPANNTSETISICQGDTLYGYYTSGMFTDTFTAANGCDSIRTLMLTVKPHVFTTIDTTVCFGETVLGYNTTGTYQDTFTAANGCDSIVSLNLTVRPEINTIITQTICFGDTLFGYTTSGQFVDSYLSATGCDSTRTLNLTVRPQNTSNIARTICTGDTLEGYFTTGIYTDTFTDQYGCDSIRVLDLSIDNFSQASFNQTICFGDIYEGYSTSGTYRDTFTTSSCDSIRILNLTVLTLDTITEVVTICAGDSYAGYNASGVYIDTFTNTQGCDSIRTLNLAVLPQNITQATREICLGDSTLINGTQVTTAGIYFDTLVSTSGCAVEITEYTVVVNSLPASPSVTQNGGILSVPDAFSTYQWYQDGFALNNASTYNYTATANGQYFVAVSDTNGCTTFSDTVTVTGVGINDLNVADDLKVYPNPSTGAFNLQWPTHLSGEQQIIVRDVLGQELFNWKGLPGELKAIDLSHLGSSIYLLEWSHQGYHTQVKRLVLSR